MNVMPGEARVLVDIRTIPGQSHPDIKDKLNALGTEIEIQIRKYYEKYDRYAEPGTKS